MEDSKPEVSPEETNNESAPTENISMSDALTGVITEPGVTFEAVKASSKKNYWLIPTLLFIVVFIASSFLVLNDEELYQEIKTKQTTAVKERLEKAVKDGKMSQEKANEQIETIDKQMSKSNPLFYVFATLGPVFTIFIMLMLKGGLFFGVFKIFKGSGTFVNILSALGLASLIEVMQTVVDTVLAIIMGKLNSNIGPTILLTADSVGKDMFKFLAHFDLFTIWYLVVLGIAFAKVSQLKTSVTMPVVFVLWLVWISLTSFLNLGFFGM
jgi:hypothetical protein